MQTVFSRLRLTLKWIFLALALGASFGVQAQQGWPNRPLHLLVPTPPGGSTDILGRLVGQKLSESLGQPVIVENRAGATGNVAASYFVKSPPNDHSFLLVIMSQLSVNQFLFRELGYDPDADLKPIGIVATTSNVIVVSPSLKVSTLKELVEYGKAHPDKFAYSSPGVGSTGHLLNEVFKANAGLNLLHVPYRGNALAVMALIAGDVQLENENAAVVLPHIKAGKLRALAVTSPKRMVQLPEVPTVSEAGFPYLTMRSWWGLVAQAKTPPEVIVRMNRELVAILQKPDVVARLRDNILEPLPGTPEDMTAIVIKDRESWKKAIETSGIKAE